MVAHIAAGVGTESVEEEVADIADRAEVQLGDPTLFGVELGGFAEEVSGQTVGLAGGELFAASSIPFLMR